VSDRLFKFLRTDRLGPFSTVRWPTVGEWLDVPRPLRPCRNGLHVCTVADLPYWLSDELWEVEVAGERMGDQRKQVVERARLQARITWWPERGWELADDCLAVLRNFTSDELQRAGRDRLPEQATKEALKELVKREVGRVDVRLSAAGRSMLSFLSEALMYRADEPSGPAAAARHITFVTAYAADHVTRAQRLPLGTTAFGLERSRQAAWFEARLG